MLLWNFQIFTPANFSVKNAMLEKHANQHSQNISLQWTHRLDTYARGRGVGGGK
jgi:hypothetical protein